MLSPKRFNHLKKPLRLTIVLKVRVYHSRLWSQSMFITLTFCITTIWVCIINDAMYMMAYGSRVFLTRFLIFSSFRRVNYFETRILFSTRFLWVQEKCKKETLFLGLWYHVKSSLLFEWHLQNGCLQIKTNSVSRFVFSSQFFILFLLFCCTHTLQT